MTPYHTVTNVHTRGDLLLLTIDGMEYTFSFEAVSPALAHASEEEQKAFEVSPSGYGIHWSLIDEDLSIDGLLGIVHAPGLQRQSA